MAWFAIVLNSDGELLAFESDAATNRPTDAALLATGKVRVAVTAPLLLTERWNKTLRVKELIPVVANAVIPPVTKAQTAGFLKSLLENPPTVPIPWTQLQRDQALYLLLLGMFRDLKSGVAH